MSIILYYYSRCRTDILHLHLDAGSNMFNCGRWSFWNVPKCIQYKKTKGLHSTSKDYMSLGEDNFTKWNVYYVERLYEHDCSSDMTPEGASVPGVWWQDSRRRVCTCGVVVTLWLLRGDLEAPRCCGCSCCCCCSSSSRKSRLLLELRVGWRDRQGDESSIWDS